MAVPHKDAELPQCGRVTGAQTSWTVISKFLNPHYHLERPATYQNDLQVLTRSRLATDNFCWHRIFGKQEVIRMIFCGLHNL